VGIYVDTSVASSSETSIRTKSRLFNLLHLDLHRYSAILISTHALLTLFALTAHAPTT